MHRRGVSSSTRHFRNGIEIEPISVNNFYDFNFQNARFLPSTSNTILPGDSMITRCVWDTSKDKTVVSGGLSSENEMCFDFLEYYPRVNLNLCGQTGNLYGVTPNKFLCSTVSKQQFFPANPLDFPDYKEVEYPSYKCALGIERNLKMLPSGGNLVVTSFTLMFAIWMFVGM